MTYKYLNTILYLYALLFCALFLEGQELTSDDLRQKILTYKNLTTNEERDAFLNNFESFLKDVPKDSIESFYARNKTSFAAQFAMADYLRLNSNNKLARKIYADLEKEILSTSDIDYAMLSVLYWNKSRAISYKNFDYKIGIQPYIVGLEYAKKSKVDKSIIRYHGNLAFFYNMLADYDRYVFHNNERYEIALRMKDTVGTILALKNIMNDFLMTRDSENALSVWKKISPMLNKDFSNYPYSSQLLTDVTNAFINVKKIDSALYYNRKCYYLDSVNSNFNRNSFNELNRGKILFALSKFNEAEQAFLKCNTLAIEGGNYSNQAFSAQYLAKIYIDRQKSNKAIRILKQSYSKSKGYRSAVKGEIEMWLSKAFEASKALDSALVYRDKAEVSFNIENKEIQAKQIALAKAKLGFDEIADKNKSLDSINKTLDDQIVKTKKNKNLILLSFAVVVFILGLFLYHRHQKEKLRVSQYQEQLSNKERIAIEAELNTIRSQMNPHFMFNSLNSINEFIQNDSGEEASNYLVKFSRLMRSTLNYSKRKFVTLEEEIDLLKLYVELENLRFYNSIDFKLDIDVSINLEKTLIPPMMLQPFVENAIWHGLMPKDTNRKLSLHFHETKENLICDIEDNGIGRVASAAKKAQGPNHKSQGIGLTKRRLELLENIHGKEAGIEVIDLEEAGKASGTLVKVTLPKQTQI